MLARNLWKISIVSLSLLSPSLSFATVDNWGLGKYFTILAGMALTL